MPRGRAAWARPQFRKWETMYQTLRKPLPLAAGCAALAIAAAAGHLPAGAARARAAQPASAPYAWRNVEIVGGGFVDGILPHPRVPGLMYARTDVGGAYRFDPATRRGVALTDDFGRDDWNLTGIESIGLDPTDANRVYAAVGTYTNDWAGNGAILRSRDQGRTWLRTNVPFKMGGNEDGRFAGERLAVDPREPSILFFGSRHNGLWRSSDYAATWQQVPGAAPDGAGIDFVVFPPSSGSGRSKRFYLGLSTKTNSLSQTDDAGATFHPVPGGPSGLIPSHGVPGANGALFLSYGDAPGPNGMTDGAVYRFDTRSGTWTNITPLAPGGTSRFGYAGLAVDARHPGTLMVATMDRWSVGDTLFRSVDSGAHWTDIGPKSVRDISGSPWIAWGKPTAPLGHWIGALAIDPFDSGHALYGTGATIWASHDVSAADQGAPTHWGIGAQGLEETVVTGLVSPAAGAPLLSAVGDIDGFRHTDLRVSPATGFFQPAHGLNTGIDAAGNDPNIVARVFDGQGTGGALSRDNGRTWSPFPSAPDGAKAGAIAVSADGRTLVWTPAKSATVVSSDGGTTWVARPGAPTGMRIVADRADPARFYGRDRETGALYASADRAATFTRTAAGLPRGDGEICAAPGRPGDVYVAAPDGLHHSVDGARTFRRLPGLTAAYRVGFGRAANAGGPTAIFVTARRGGSDGIYRSFDGGMSWSRIDDDAHRFATINVITGDPRVVGRVYLGTGGRGILYGEPAIERSARH
jgi:hypothetical protein